jgi:hypothetical protein
MVFEKEKEMVKFKDTAIFYGDKPNRGDYDNGVWMDMLGIPFIQRLEEAGSYSTIIRTLWLEAIGWSKEIRDRYPHVRQIGLSDHPLSAHISKLPAERQHAYLADLQYLDGIMALTEEERQFYQTALPSIPVERVGLPFPVDNYENLYGDFRNKERTYIGLGVGAADNDRNFISNLLVFRRLQLNNPNLVGVFLSIPHQLLSYCSYWADKVANVYIQERTTMGDFYDILSQCQFVISLTDRNTPGRLQGEAAFFEIPVVGSNRLELQDELFPLLAVKPYEIESATNRAQFLLDHPDRGRMLGEQAHKKLVTTYSYKKSIARYRKLLNRIEGD